MIYFIIILITNLFAQICINEFMSSNTNTLYDSSGDTPDWIEIYNSGDDNINLLGFGLSDDPADPFKWTFPGTEIEANSHLLVFASNQNNTAEVQHWETVIDWGDEWRYFIGDTPPPNSWMNSNFDDSNWLVGQSGFGYGDGDDSTEIPAVMSIFTRRTFQVDAFDEILNVMLHVDYDDAFVAYINGIPLIVFRSLSDLTRGGPGANQMGTFLELASRNSASVVLAFLDAWWNR